MHKKGEMYTTCSPRSKMGYICQKMFFVNFAHFLQKHEPVRILLLCIIFVIFAKMCPFFPGEVPRGNLDKLYKILK